MNRSQLLKAVAAHTGQDPKAVDVTLKGFTEVVTAVNAKGEPIAISGFAKFSRVETKARMGRNPATGEPVKIKASKKVRITPLKAFKEAVLTPSLAPKLAKGVWPPAATPPTKKAQAEKAAKPATKAPAAKAPTTKAPAAKAPTTKAPAAKAPTTKAPAAKAPTTKAPATKAPATKAPATKAPATKAPATKAPATKAPATKAPATKAPATKAPATKAPASRSAARKTGR